jgi:rhodanese-related sulfurtransferase
MSKIKDINAKKLKEFIEKEEALIVDVREPAEHRSERIKGAHSLPFSKLSCDAIQDLELDGKKIILHCQSGRRSQAACEKLLKEGVEGELYNLQDGIEGWKQHPFPTEKSGTRVLPLDRQVQLAISLMILVGLFIGFWIHPAGYLLPLIAGLGLANAALTGWCGLALLMAKMPWNRI